MNDFSAHARRESADVELAIDGGSPAVPEGPPAWPPPDDDVRLALEAAYADGSWGRYHGGRVEALAERLAALHQVAHALPCSSGTFAVELALRAIKVNEGDEVVLAAYDFPGNFRAIEAVGARPVLVDIDPAIWGIDVEQFVQAISPDTRAVIISHLHGGLAKIEAICEIADARGVAVVEDACQAAGATVNGKPAGWWGDVGVLSFGGSKLLTAGRGGAIVTRDAATHQRAKIFCERGNDAFPLSELQAAVLLPQLDKLPERNQRRRENVERLVSALQVSATGGQRPAVTQRTGIRSQGAGVSERMAAHGDAPVAVTPVQWNAARGEPAYYKLAFLYDPEACGGWPRERFLAAVGAEGIALGAGFRGFARRGRRRCRKVGDLAHSIAAAERTVLLHHPVLLEPPETINRVAAGLVKVVRAACNSRK